MNLSYSHPDHASTGDTMPPHARFASSIAVRTPGCELRRDGMSMPGAATAVGGFTRAASALIAISTEHELCVCEADRELGEFLKEGALPERLVVHFTQPPPKAMWDRHAWDDEVMKTYAEDFHTALCAPGCALRELVIELDAQPAVSDYANNYRMMIVLLAAVVGSRVTSLSLKLGAQAAGGRPARIGVLVHAPARESKQRPGTGADSRV
jgi:hypothetical protein